MPGLTTAGRDQFLARGVGAFAYASLHSADAGVNGAAELSGGRPAYERQPITWEAPEDGSVVGRVPAIDVPAGVDVVAIGYWSSPLGGVFYGSREVTPERYGSQGTYEPTVVEAVS